MGQAGEIDVGDGAPKFAVIDHAAADNTIVAAVAGKRIRVVSYFLVNTTAQTIRFESAAGGTALTGQMALANNGVLEAPFNPMGHFQTVKGELLNLELSGATSVDGHLTYIEVD